MKSLIPTHFNIIVEWLTNKLDYRILELTFSALKITHEKVDCK